MAMNPSKIKIRVPESGCLFRDLASAA
jgi:hypothetical protein